MIKISRAYKNLDTYVKPNKALIIFGARQVGNTTLLQDYLQTTKLKYKLDSGDNIHIQQLLDSQDIDKIVEYAQGYELIAIDEAQKIKNVGQGLKILIDNIPGIKIIATGSSSFELAGQIGEPLTGRKITLTLYPISQLELESIYNRYELKRKLEEFLIYGSYPEIITSNNKTEKIRLLNEIASSYLLKDILELERVKSSKILIDLLRHLAFQIGSEVSLTEIAQKIGIDYKTVARYIDLFEKAFVLYNLRGFSRNLRKEITKKSKYYFYDTGIRNAIISNFNSLDIRNDAGILWENFLFMERLKKQAYKDIYTNNYFWRTWDQKEIDLVEEREGKLFGYEFKWGNKPIKAPKEWLNTYSNAEFFVINQDNYLDFIT
jgi:hypothetical protein